MNPTSRSAHQGVKAAQLCNCNLSSYSNFSAAFSCGVKENLCPDRLPSPTLMPALTPVSLSTIAPSPSNAPSFTPTSNIPPVDDQGNFFNIREYSVLVTSAGIEVSSILQQRSFDPAVFAVASCLIIILVAGFVYFSRWDASDRHAVSKQPIAVDEASQNYPLIYRKSLNAALPELSSVS